MAEKPKTWLPSEVCQLMAEEMRAYKHDCVLKGYQFSYVEMAGYVYGVLEEQGLIELTP